MDTAISIMVVDDDADIREGVRDLLESKGYSVVTATNGIEALAELHKGARPAVILLDLMMPVMDGYQFATEYRKSATFGRIPIVAVTADGHAKQKAASIGAEGHLQNRSHTACCWSRWSASANPYLRVILGFSPT